MRVAAFRIYGNEEFVSVLAGREGRRGVVLIVHALDEGSHLEPVALGCDVEAVVQCMLTVEDDADAATDLCRLDDILFIKVGNKPV